MKDKEPNKDKIITERIKPGKEKLVERKIIHKDPSAVIGEAIRQTRAVEKVSQEELGEYLGLAKQTISKIEKGTRKVTAAELQRIGEFFGKGVSYFLEFKKTAGKEEEILTEEPEAMNKIVKMYSKVKSNIETLKPVDASLFKIVDELIKWSGHRGFTRYIKDYLRDEGLSREEIEKVWEDTSRTGRNG